MPACVSKFAKFACTTHTHAHTQLSRAVLVHCSFTVHWCARIANVYRNLYRPSEIWHWKYVFTFQLLCYNSVLQRIKTTTTTTSTVITTCRGSLPFFEMVTHATYFYPLNKASALTGSFTSTTEVFCCYQEMDISLLRS
jgi:hypothetical protein